MRTENEINRMMHDMCDAVGFKYRSIHFLDGNFPEITVNLEDLSKGEIISEKVSLLSALSAFVFSIYMYTLNLNDSNISYELNRVLMEYWKNWGLRPFPYIGFYAIQEFNFQVNFLVAIPEEMYGMSKTQTVSYMRTHMRQRICHEGNPSGIYVNVSDCIVEFSSMITALVLEMGNIENIKGNKTND